MHLFTTAKLDEPVTIELTDLAGEGEGKASQPVLRFGTLPSASLHLEVNDLIRLRDAITDWLRAGGHEPPPEVVDEGYERWLDQQHDRAFAEAGERTDSRRM